MLAPIPLLFSTMAGARGKAVDAEATMEHVAGALVAMAGLATCMIIASAPALLDVWLGRAGDHSVTLLRILSAGYAFQVTTAPYTAALKARATYRSAAIYSGAAACLNIGLTAVLAPFFGLLGIVLATGVSLAPPCAWFLHHVGHELESRRSPLVSVLQASAAAAIAATTGAVVCGEIHNGLAALLLSAAAAAVVYAAAISRTGLVAPEVWRALIVTSGLRR
jgi:O-antigen/teichoic acid export membrane protein